MKVIGRAHNMLMKQCYMAAAIGLFAAPWLHAQSTVSADTVSKPASRDSSRRAPARLAPIEIHATIVPTAGVSIESGMSAQITRVSGSDLQGWRPRTLTEGLATLPSVSSYDDLGTPWKLNLSGRGFSVGPTVGVPSGMTVFLDGVRQNEPDAQEVNFDLLPVDQLSHVELLRGNASLLGPNSLGGAINLVTRRGNGPQSGEIETSLGSFGSYGLRANMGGSDSAWHYYGGGGVSSEDGWRHATGDHAYDGFLSVGRGSAERGVTLRGHFARSRAETAGSLPESVFDHSPQTNFTPGDFEDLNAQQLSLSANGQPAGGSGSLTLFVRHSGAERFNVNQMPDPNVRGLTADYSVGGTADWRRVFAISLGSLALRAGIDGSANRVRVRIFNEAQAAAGSMSEAELTTDVRSPSWDVAEYAMVDLNVGRVTFSGGGRHDYLRVPFKNQLDRADDSTNVFTRLSPRAGLSVDVAPSIVFNASASESFRAPAILELGCADPEAQCPLPFALGDDPPLKPIRARTYEAGLTWGRDAIRLSGSVYRTNVHNEIFFIASESSILSGYFTNIDLTRRQGLELSVQGDATRFDWYANCAFTRATFESPTQIFSIRADDDFTTSSFAGSNTVARGNELPLVPDHQLKIGASARVTSALTGGLDARYVGRQWLRGDEANETKPLDGYTVVNARLSLGIKDWTIGAVVANVFDTKSAVFGTFNENRQTGELERFLTPMNARTVRIELGRSFGKR